MRKFCLFLGIFTLLLASCSQPNDSQTTQQTTQPNNSNVSKNTSQTKEKNSQDPEEENKELSQKERENLDVPGLVPPTDPQDRRREISASEGRRDPFELIPLKSNKRVEPPTPVVSDDDKNNNDEPTTKINNTDLASEVIVTGVVTVSGSTKIVLKAPNEQYSRYVSLGEYVADGKVLVKSVKIESGSPVVILEQSGVEVRKELGQGA